MTIRVLHITEAQGGGVESAIAHFVRETPGMEHTLIARVRRGESTTTPEQLAVVPVTGSLPQFIRVAREQAINLAPDVVHLHSSFAGLMRFALPAQIPRVYSPHCFAFERSDVSRVLRTAYRYTEQLLARRTDVVVSVSPWEEQLARGLRRGLPVRTVSNYAPRELSRATTSRANRIITVARICPQKDPEFFAAVARKVSKQIDVQFEWIGDGNESSRETLRRAGVTVTGWIPHADIAPRLAASGLYLHTALWEASPMSLAEALDVDVPILCRTLPTLDSLGYALAGTSVNEVAESVVRFFADDERPAQVSSRNETARQRMRAVSASSVLPDAYYEAITSKSKKRDR